MALNKTEAHTALLEIDATDVLCLSDTLIHTGVSGEVSNTIIS